MYTALSKIGGCSPIHWHHIQSQPTVKKGPPILESAVTTGKRKLTELLKRCHPLGWFEGMSALGVATNAEELYHAVLVETPLDACSRLDFWIYQSLRC
jgi:hypothetical protein